MTQLSIDEILDEFKWQVETQKGYLLITQKKQAKAKAQFVTMIEQYLGEVISSDDEGRTWVLHESTGVLCRNELRAEQRQRAAAIIERIKS